MYCANCVSVKRRGTVPALWPLIAEFLRNIGDDALFCPLAMIKSRTIFAILKCRRPLVECPGDVKFLQTSPQGRFVFGFKGQFVSFGFLFQQPRQLLREPLLMVGLLSRRVIPCFADSFDWRPGRSWLQLHPNQ